jgi:hypothetical protein
MVGNDEMQGLFFQHGRVKDEQGRGVETLSEATDLAQMGKPSFAEYPEVRYLSISRKGS